MGRGVGGTFLTYIVVLGKWLGNQTGHLSERPPMRPNCQVDFKLPFDSMIERLLHFLPDKIRPSSRVQGFPGLRIIVVRHAWPPVVCIIAVAVIGFPSHCLLARWLNLVCNVAGDISRTIVNLTIFRNRIPYVMGENVLALKCWIQIRSREKVSTQAGRAIRKCHCAYRKYR